MMTEVQVQKTKVCPFPYLPIVLIIQKRKKNEGLDLGLKKRMNFQLTRSPPIDF